MVDDEVVRLQPHEELDLDAAIGRRRHRGQKRLVGNEVGARDGHPLGGVLDEGQDHPQVRLSGISGARGHQLHGIDNGVGPARLRGRSADGSRFPEHLRDRHGPTGLRQNAVEVEHLAGLEVPVHLEDRLGLDDDVPGDLHAQVRPSASGPNIGAQPVARVDDVVGADEGPLAVDDEELAVVAQVGAAEAPLVRQQRHHESPLNARGGEATAQPPPAGVLARPQMIHQQAHGHAAGDGPLQRGVEDVGDRIPGLDVELDVDVTGGGVDGAGHLGVGGRRVAVQGDDVAGHARQARQSAVHPQNRVQVRRVPAVLGRVGHVLGGFQGELVDGRLLRAALAVDPRTAQEDVER